MEEIDPYLLYLVSDDWKPSPDLEAEGDLVSAEYDFMEKCDILDERYEYVESRDFYRTIFQEGQLERLGHPEDKRGNGIAISIDSNTGKARKTIITDGLEQLDELLEEPFVVCSPISYFGRSRRADHALWLHAVTLDVDYVGVKQLECLIYWIEELENTPRPTYIVNSGHGLHLYYVLDHPIEMYEKNQKELVKLKKNLIDQVWTKYTSEHPERKEALGIVQGFRMVGSKTKMGRNTRLVAYRTGDPVSLEYLNSFAYGGNEANINQPSLFSLEQAKEAWPDWYEKRIIRGEIPGRWHVSRRLYDWYLNRALGEATIGHRYFCVMCLAIFAKKCDVSQEELFSDAFRLQKAYNELGKKTREPFLWEEAVKALECYNECYVTFPRETIERLTGISMPANKRNGRTQKDHLRRARAVQDIDYPNGEWRGRPTKSLEIRAYAKAHPEANHSEIARALGVSRPTVIKWLKTAPKG